MGDDLSSVRKRHPRVVFVRIGWMKFYGALAGADDLVGGGAFNNNDVGNEVANFAVQPSGNCEGWFQPPAGGAGFALPRIVPDVDRDAEYIDDVLVVMIATDPNRRGQRVVGWYEHAQCWWTYDEGEPRWHQFLAAPKDCVLVPAAARHLGPLVPRGKGSMGQANVYYTYDAAGRPQLSPWIDEVLAYVETYNGPNVMVTKTPPPEAQRAAARAGEQTDQGLEGQGYASRPDARAAVERRAVAVATAHYVGQGWTVESTEANRTTEYLDLLCTRGAERRTVEVKGTTGGSEAIWLTQNEVVHARTNTTSVALVVVHGIALRETPDGPNATGGTARVIDPWDIGAGVLQPLAYRYVLPA